MFLREPFWLILFQFCSGAAIDQPLCKRTMTISLSSVTGAHLKFVMLCCLAVWYLPLSWHKDGKSVFVQCMSFGPLVVTVAVL